MKINRLFFTFTVLTILLAAACSSLNKKCTIRGTTHGVEDDTLILGRMGEDFRFEGIEIPIVDSSFEYEFDLVQPEAGMLFFKESRYQGGGARLLFFLEPGEIKISLYPREEFKNCRVDGGKINKEYKEYHDQLDTLFWLRIMPLTDSLRVLSGTRGYYSDTMRFIEAQYAKAVEQDEKDKLSNIMRKMSDENLLLSEPARLLKDKSDAIVKEMTAWKQEYISKNPSIISYYLLYANVMYEEDKIDLEMAERSHIELAQKYPDHPYTEKVGMIMESMKTIKVGGKYIDFTAPDLDGNPVKLSEAIEGKIALIDLWASWCGPCIRHSRSMIPVYEEFKDLGFTIVGVAAEYDNTDQMVLALEREKYPWLNLVELDKQNRIWDKYGISNSGGSSFLVDRDGTILAIHPTAEETRDILKELD